MLGCNQRNCLSELCIYHQASIMFACDQNSTWNNGLFRILSPYLYNKIGIGHNAKAMNARRELPHPSPRESYIFGPANGNRAPTNDRRTALAARAEAACRLKASIRYVDTGI